MGDDFNSLDSDLFHVVRESGFVVLFMLGADDRVDTVEDVEPCLITTVPLTP